MSKLCLIVALLLSAVRLAAQCTTNCVITNPTGNQVISQPSGTSLGVNLLEGNNTVAGSFTFGSATGSVPPFTGLWNTAMFAIGNTLSKVGNSNVGSADEFTTYIQSSLSSTSSAASYFKGALFTEVATYDPTTVSVVRSSNSITGYSHIASTNSSGYAEGIVMTADFAPDTNIPPHYGDGLLIAGEFDITNNGSGVNAHCDSGATSKCKTNLWLGSSGPNPGSWVLDTLSAGGGWYNGISLRNIQSSGIALAIPNFTYITSRNGANSNDVIMMFVDSNNIMSLGFGTAAITLSNGIYDDGTGVKHLRVSGCSTAASVGATCATSISWTSTFSSASYTVSCTGDGISSGVPLNGGLTTKSAGSITFQTVAATAVAAKYTSIDCVAVHD